MISVKLAEKEAKLARAERSSKLAQLKEIAFEKQVDGLKGKTEDEINKMIEELESEE